MLDGGADHHMVNKLFRLTNVVMLKDPIHIGCADSSAPNLMGTHMGDLHIEIKSRFGKYTEIVLQNVLYVPKLARNLISNELIVESGRYHLDYRSKYADVIESETNTVVCTAFTVERTSYSQYDNGLLIYRSVQMRWSLYRILKKRKGRNKQSSGIDV